MRLREMLKDVDLLRLAAEADDEVSLCEQVSRRHGLELTLGQAGKIMERTRTHCAEHGSKLPADGYCKKCETEVA